MGKFKTTSTAVRIVHVEEIVERASGPERIGHWRFISTKDVWGGVKLLPVDECHLPSRLPLPLDVLEIAIEEARKCWTETD